MDTNIKTIVVPLATVVACCTFLVVGSFKLGEWKTSNENFQNDIEEKISANEAKTAEALLGLAATLAEVQIELSKTRKKGEQDWTRGQMNRFSISAEKAAALDQPWPKVWNPEFDAKE